MWGGWVGAVGAVGVRVGRSAGRVWLLGACGVGPLGARRRWFGVWGAVSAWVGDGEQGFGAWVPFGQPQQGSSCAAAHHGGQVP